MAYLVESKKSWGPFAFKKQRWQDGSFIFVAWAGELGFQITYHADDHSWELSLTWRYWRV